jgi:uncharacterized NAD-dependent epimerase/dehydratase family protein
VYKIFTTPADGTRQMIASASHTHGPKPIGLTHSIATPYLIFLGDVDDRLTAKTGFGLVDWRPESVVAQWRISADAISLNVPDMVPAESRLAGARSLVIGAAPVGGQIPANWGSALLEAAEAGLDIVSGLHTRLADVPGLSAAAERRGVRLVDIRKPPSGIPVGTGAKRSGKRVLTVGTDCAIGKKYAALGLHKAMLARGWDADFRATGQTGILIAGAGMPIDSVVADFISGAAEALSPDAAPGHWDVIEGQGSLFHPSYAGVSLGLLHGSQPDALVLCVDPNRQEVDGCPGFAIPSAAEAIARNVEAARLTNPACFCAGISFNASRLPPGEKAAVAARLTAETGLPALDPLQDDLGPILDVLQR